MSANEGGPYLRYAARDRKHARGNSTHLPPPQCRLPTLPAPTSSRFRSTHHGYDDIEDDWLRFNSFGESVLQQPFPDRQQARPRLLLAPGTTSHFNHVSGLAPQGSSATLESCEYDSRNVQSRGLVDHPIRSRSERYAFHVESFEESSSDAPLGFSSSPARKAGERRTEIRPFDDVPTPRIARDQRSYAGHREQSGPHSYPDGDQLRAIPPVNPIHLASARLHKEEPTAVSNADSRPHARGLHPIYAPPIGQGIQLIPVSNLPDRLRTVFPYPTFNAVQSKCFDTVFRSDENFVLASPTGSGKTVILELAICRAVATNATGQYKVVYQAPTKALCSERQRDWAAKFTPIGLKCAELTGDSDASDIRNVQSANIIITTPEKWDSITRKWQDHERLMRLVKVFLIDEVHILKDDRGAVLEAVVSRMKSIGTNVRFVALSATVPNLTDVAAWLGKNSSQPHVPALHEKFGEEFRPVRLQKHVCGYVSNTSNEFGFEKTLDGRLPDVMTKFSEGKPIMIFCATRTSCVNTAKLLAKYWMSCPRDDRKWNAPSKQVPMLNKDLRDISAAGVAFHHAGLDLSDRLQVERSFLDHTINVICCTSTLAVGVNLPCHLVIIKNTVTYTDEGMQEYSDLEMMQMLGRAGRPQFDDSAVAVIMTRQTKARRYESMVTGQDFLESKLHLNLIDHMNAEIGLGTIRDLASARKWLKGTFLYVRLQQNPDHYKLEGSNSGQDIEERVEDICSRDIALLRDYGLMSDGERFQCTDHGHAMARYYVHFETMKVFIGIQAKATPSEILSAIAQASEFSRLRFRSGEKAIYKMLNKSPSIRFSIPVNLDLPAHKVSLIIQAVLGSADLIWDGEFARHKSQYMAETQIVFKNVNSLIRCIIDCQISMGDSISIHSALMLERSLGSRTWDDSPLQMKQVDSIGVVGVRKFVNAGIRSLEDLEACEAHRIETLIGRNPPYGMKILETVKAFPKLRVALHVQPTSTAKCADGVKIQVKAEIGFMNDVPPQRFAGKPVYVCLLAETSDGRKIHFARISGQKLGHVHSLSFPAILTRAEQCINCYVMCDSIAGTLRGATIKPQLAASMFQAMKLPAPLDVPQRSNTSKRRAEPVKSARIQSDTSDEFGDDDIDDEALVQATCSDLDFEDIDNFAEPTDAITKRNITKNKAHGKTQSKMQADMIKADDERDAVQLSNGKWACKHSCKDKNACKHLCCKEGMDKPPKKPAVMKRVPIEEDCRRPGHSGVDQTPKVTQSKLQLIQSKRKPSPTIEELDLTRESKKKRKEDDNKNGLKDYQDLYKLQKAAQKQELPSTIHSAMHKKSAYCYSQGGGHNLSFLQEPEAADAEDVSDYGGSHLDDLSSYWDIHPPTKSQNDLSKHQVGLESVDFANHSANAPITSNQSDTFGDDDSLLGDAMIGLADSQTLQEMKDSFRDTTSPSKADVQNLDVGTGYPQDDLAVEYGDMMDEPIERHVSESTMVRGSISKRFDTVSTHELCPSLCNTTESNKLRAMELELGSKPSCRPETRVFSQTQLPASDIERMEDENAFNEVEMEECLEVFGDKSFEKEKVAPDAYKNLDPWIFREFGNVVELVDV
ncbi:ATP-dependent DNA helicase MER3 [Pleosporales sp. CAS-2024a]